MTKIEIVTLFGDQLIDAFFEHRAHLFELRLDLGVEVLLSDFVITDSRNGLVGIVGPRAGRGDCRAQD